MAKRIVNYTTPSCGDCKAAKRFLGERGIAYEEVDIEQGVLRNVPVLGFVLAGFSGTGGLPG